MIEQEESNKAELTSQQLQEQAHEKSRALKKLKRLHGLCFKEIISNIDELERRSKKLVKCEIIKELLKGCPIDFKIPIHSNSSAKQKIQSLSERRSQISHSQQIQAEKSMLQVVERPSAAESKIPNQKAEEQPLYSNIDGKEAQWQLDAMRKREIRPMGPYLATKEEGSFTTFFYQILI